MSLLIQLTKEALQEEAEAYLFYERCLEGLDERFLNEVEDNLQRIAANPAYYSYTDTTHTIRDVALTVFPFSIIYEEKGNHIVVYHIHHAKKELK